MATRRIPASEKAPVDQVDARHAGSSDTTPAVPTSIIAKLLLFTAGMITLPIGSYFLSVNTLFGGNATYAGALAAIVANVVLISYCIVAFQDDKSERAADAEEKKKSR